ncbi:hypothetical protein [Cyclobacterium qasimii]|uniref:Iron uptake protein n=1 Tax=Cyclobacterium qasimii M12-11B TaxID=641524 RepID=S7WI78_9BACT|nr:hypothetical protein [Cyclobacterium qasimii]EPR66434.1 hypothetical protein ADICYQ_4568 [Cyclobacterium qasimii M12-11B]
MPANKKHLSPNFLHRFSRITAGLVGGYLVTASFFLALSFLWDKASVLYTLVFGGFILWVTLLIIAFIAKKGWKVWAIYLLLTLAFSTIVYFCKPPSL